MPWAWKRLRRLSDLILFLSYLSHLSPFQLVYYLSFHFAYTYTFHRKFWLERPGAVVLGYVSMIRCKLKVSKKFICHLTDG